MQTWIDTLVRPERGQWTVILVVATSDGVQERVLRTCRTQAYAELVASSLRRSARRYRATPPDPDVLLDPQVPPRQEP